MATVHVASGVPDTYTIRAQDETIYYEDAKFTSIRGAPADYLEAGSTDCIELYTDGGEFGVLVRGIYYAPFDLAPPKTSTSITRYSVTFNLNSVDYI